MIDRRNLKNQCFRNGKSPENRLEYERTNNKKNNKVDRIRASYQRSPLYYKVKNYKKLSILDCNNWNHLTVCHLKPYSCVRIACII